MSASAGSAGRIIRELLEAGVLSGHSTAAAQADFRVRINEVSNAGANPDAHYQNIGTLDIYGFERLEHNSFEQLLDHFCCLCKLFLGWAP